MEKNSKSQSIVHNEDSKSVVSTQDEKMYLLAQQGTNLLCIRIQPILGHELRKYVTPFVVEELGTMIVLSPKFKELHYFLVEIHHI